MVFDIAQVQKLGEEMGVKFSDKLTPAMLRDAMECEYACEKIEATRTLDASDEEIREAMKVAIDKIQ